jgi:hypothetical protein
VSGAVTAVLFLLALVLATSMSAKGERFRAWMLAAVVLLLSSTPAMTSVHGMLLSLVTSFN